MIRALRSTTPFPRIPLERARALHAWATRNVVYIPDVRDEETLQSPGVTLGWRGGDCDDHSSLLGAMLRSAGLRVRMRATGIGGLSHVFPEVNIDGKWIAADSTRSRFGTRNPFDTSATQEV